MLSMILMLAACSKDSGSTPMTPLSDANVQDVKKTMSAFVDVNTAVMTASKNRQTSTGGSSTSSMSTSGISQIMGLSASITDSSPVPSEKANRLASKLTQDVCDITSTGLDKLQNGSSKISNINDVNISVHVGGADCPMSYDLNVTASQSSQNQAVIHFSMKFQANSDDFKTMSEVQSADMQVQVAVTGSQSQVTMNITGSGGIATLTQGQLSFYANGAFTGSQGVSHADVRTGIVYPTFKADLHIVADASNGSDTKTQMFLNDRPVTESDLQKTFSAN